GCRSAAAWGHLEVGLRGLLPATGPNIVHKASEAPNCRSALFSKTAMAACGLARRAAAFITCIPALAIDSRRPTAYRATTSIRSSRIGKEIFWSRRRKVSIVFEALRAPRWASDRASAENLPLRSLPRQAESSGYPMPHPSTVYLANRFPVLVRQNYQEVKQPRFWKTTPDASGPASIRN